MCSNSAIAPRIWKNIRPDRSGGVDSLVVHHQVDAAPLEVCRRLDQAAVAAGTANNGPHH
jgi:hypothetical protein